MPETSLPTTPPTTRKTRKLVSTYVDMYKAFEGKDKISKNEYRLILKYFNNLIRKSLLYDALAYTLPYSVGVLGISSAHQRESRNLPLDFQHYKETGEKRSLLNLSTDGRVLKILIRPKENKLYFNSATRRIFNFKAARGFTRELAKVIKNGQSVYKYHSYETYFY